MLVEAASKLSGALPAPASQRGRADVRKEAVERELAFAQRRTFHAGLRRADRVRFFIPRAQRRAGFVPSEPRRRASTIPPWRPAEGRPRAGSRSSTDPRPAAVAA